MQSLSQVIASIKNESGMTMLSMASVQPVRSLIMQQSMQERMNLTALKVLIAFGYP